MTAQPCCLGEEATDRESQGRESIAAKLVSNMITEAGASRALVCDLHSSQAMGYFDIPVDHVYGQPVILDYLASKPICSNDLVVVSPDVGGVARARTFAKELSDAPLAIVDKRRRRSIATKEKEEKVRNQRVEVQILHSASSMTAVVFIGQVEAITAPPPYDPPGNQVVPFVVAEAGLL